jgi:hypothetical protein
MLSFKIEGRECKMEPEILTSVNYKICGRDNVVGTATVYELGGSGLKPRWGRHFSHPSRPVLKPIQLSVKGYSGSFPGVNWPERGVGNLPPSSAEVTANVWGFAWKLLFGLNVWTHSSFSLNSDKNGKTFVWKLCVAGLRPHILRHFKWKPSAGVSQTIRSSYFSHMTAAAT